MAKRQTSRDLACESLEGRQLLSTLSASLAAANRHAAHAAAVEQHAAAHAQRLAARRGHIAGGGPVSTAYTTPNRATGAVGRGPRIAAIEAAARARAAASVVAPPATPTATTPPITVNTPTTATPALNYASLINTYFPSGDAGAPAAASRPSLQRTSPLKSSTRGASTAGVTRIITGTPTNTATTPAEPANTTTPAEPANTTTPAAAPLTPPVPQGTGVAPSSGSASMMAPNDILGGVTLSPAAVAAVRSSVDTFAGSYTSGQDATRDAAAVAALQSSLNGVSQGLWAATHVAPASSVAGFQKAADTFATAYTSGKNPAADQAAWTALQSSLNTFAGSLASPGTPADPSMRSSPDLMPGFTNNLTDSASSLVSGPTLGAADVATFKASIDTFATAYTSGKDSAADQAASSALGSSLDTLLASQWAASATTMDAARMNPGPPTAMPVTTTATPAAPNSLLTHTDPASVAANVPTMVTNSVTKAPTGTA